MGFWEKVVNFASIGILTTALRNMYVELLVPNWNAIDVEKSLAALEFRTGCLVMCLPAKGSSADGEKLCCSDCCPRCTCVDMSLF